MLLLTLRRSFLSFSRRVGRSWRAKSVHEAAARACAQAPRRFSRCRDGGVLPCVQMGTQTYTHVIAVPGMWVQSVPVTAIPWGRMKTEQNVI
jgi:hypothetical protein